MAKITPCMENGKAAVARKLENSLGFGSTEFHVFRSNGAALPEYIFQYIRQESYRRDAESEMTGSVGQKRVPVRFLEQTVLPLPPLPEQKRIVRAVGDLSSRLTLTRDRLARAPKILKAFRQSVLAAACSGRLTEDWRTSHPDIETGGDCLRRVCGETALATIPSEEETIGLPDIPKTWAWSSCEPLCDPKRDMTYGVIKLGVPVESGVPTLRSSDVRWLHVDPRNVKRIAPKIADQYSRTFLRGGELLITVRGTLGGIAVVPKEMAGFNISREVAMVPLRSEFDVHFFCYAVASIWSQNWLSDVTKGVAYTGINIRDLKRLPVGVPPIVEQHEIVRRVEALFKLADKIEARLAVATNRADKLTQAILGKAFRGELVPTEAELAQQEGRDYEPASVLLARIKTERKM